MNSWSRLKFWGKPWTTVQENLFEDDKNEDLIICPRKDEWFRAFDLTPFPRTKVLILGQDPYPTKGNANGLAFSVYPHVRPIPHSLRNIFREYCDDLGYPRPRTGDLTQWAREGVLLLNTILTVREGEPLSHYSVGWQKLAYEVVKSLSEYKENVVFILWGRKAQEYEAAIDQGKHLVLKAPHPSPLSYRHGFLGSRPFSRTNDYLTEHELRTIDWRLR